MSALLEAGQYWPGATVQLLQVAFVQNRPTPQGQEAPETPLQAGRKRSARRRIKHAILLPKKCITSRHRTVHQARAKCAWSAQGEQDKGWQGSSQRVATATGTGTATGTAGRRPPASRPAGRPAPALALSGSVASPGRPARALHPASASGHCPGAGGRVNQLALLSAAGAVVVARRRGGHWPAAVGAGIPPARAALPRHPALRPQHARPNSLLHHGIRPAPRARPGVHNL